jgi:6-phosphogluconolactonase/glucosamine-6-phosphate isomerase/deaminase
MSTDDKRLFYRELFIYCFGGRKQQFLRDTLKQFENQHCPSASLLDHYRLKVSVDSVHRSIAHMN